MKFNISVVQFETIPKEPKLNLAKAKEFIIEAKRRGSDIIVFPEMWTTGFQWDWIKQNASSHNRINESIANLALKHKIWILGSTLHFEGNGDKTNRASLYCVNGLQCAMYDKTHLFDPIDEQLHLKAGKSLTTYPHGAGKMGLALCYDLRFPGLFRSYALDGVKMIFTMAAFAAPRTTAWNTLNKARAIENQLYVICANRVGSENIPGVGPFHCCGNSAIYDPFGDVVIQASSSSEILLTAEIDLSVVDNLRKDFPTLKDHNEKLYLRN